MRRWLAFAREHHLGLPLGGVLALMWANTNSVSYFQTAQALEFWVNDVGLAFVFAYAAQEALEAMLPGGFLHPWRNAAAPVAAGIGGSIGAIAMYTAYIYGGDEYRLLQGWPIVCAVDVLFTIAIARWIFRRDAPAVFLLVMALVTDVIALAVVSGHHQFSWLRPGSGTLLIPALAFCVVLRLSGVQSTWPYLVLAGPLSWFACSALGVHPALALLPIVPFLRHAPRRAPRPTAHDDGRHTRHLEGALQYPVQLVSFLFGLVNMGVLLHGFGTGTWAVVAGSLIGRPIGILVASSLAALGGLRLPRATGWRELVVIALAATPQFAFGVFLAAAVFPTGPLMSETKLGALLTVGGVLVVLTAARLLRVGRFGSLVGHQAAINTPLSRGQVC